MKKLLVLVTLLFLSLNSNAAISFDGITNFKKLSKDSIINLISGNQLTGFVSDGPFQGPITQTYFKDGRYETIYDNKIYKGRWKVQGGGVGLSGVNLNDKNHCTKNNSSNNWTCFDWYSGNKDGGTYAYIVSGGKIFHQYHKVESANNQKVENNIVTEKEIKAAIKAKGSNYGLKKGIDAYLKGKYILAYTWFESYHFAEHTDESMEYYNDLIYSEKMSSDERAVATNRGVEIKYRIIAEKAGYKNFEEMSADTYRKKQKAEKDAYAKRKKEREQSKTPKSELLDSYVDYMVIKNIYEGSSYYVSYDQMNHVQAVTKAIESYYKNSVSSTDSIWNSAVRSYENRLAGKINSMNSFSAFNSEFSGFVDLYIMGINSRANRLGISISNTVKDF